MIIIDFRSNKTIWSWLEQALDIFGITRIHQKAKKAVQSNYLSNHSEVHHKKYKKLA